MSQTVADALSPEQLALPEYTFTIPEKARQWKGDPRTITIRSFTVRTELDAIEAAGGLTAKFVYETLQRILVKVDGKPFDQGGLDAVHGWSPKVRSLAVAAVNYISVPEEDERGPFLASVQQVVP